MKDTAIWLVRNVAAEILIVLAERIIRLAEAVRTKEDPYAMRMYMAGRGDLL